MKAPTQIIVLSVAMLLLLGTLAGFSATTYQPSLERFGWHLAWVALGGAGFALTARLNYARLQAYHLPAWGLAGAGLLLLAVLIPGVGVVRNGAARWLLFGQPSEIAKLALILFLADYGARHQGQMNERWTGFLRPMLLVGMILALVFFEPDWGTATLMAAVSLAMLAVAGTHGWHLFCALIVGAELGALLLLHNPLRLERLLAFLDPEKYRDGIGWQGWHSVVALGNGGWFGTMLGEGSHKNGFVPEQSTDFVLSLIGEELGFASTLGVVLLFGLILYGGGRIAWHVSDPFGQLLATGLTVLIGLQAFINIGVVTSSLPNKGIALPFVSYGGSNLVCLLTGLGVLISVARHGPGPVHEPVAPGAKVKVGGPVGSLRWNSCQRIRKGPLGWCGHWLRGRCDAPFPRQAMHRYQQPPIKSA